MKTKYILLSAASLFALSTACTDMDLSPAGDTVTSDTKEEILASQPEKAQASVNAVLTSFSTYMLTWPSASCHNDIGYPALMWFMDANGYDYVSDDNGYNWAGNSLTFEDRAYTSYESGIVWYTLYRQIYAANNVVATIGMEPEDDELKYYLAQALAVRAFDYWVLAQLYQFNYADHADLPCVPIITDATAEEAALNGAARNSVEEVYAQILSDLNLAIECLESSSKSRSTNNYISREVAYGLRARVNLTMENWAAAASDAVEAQAYGAPASFADVSVPTFNDLSDFMWGISVAETDAVVTSGICNWPSHTGSLNWGYCQYSGGTQISKALFDAIPATDARKGWWIDEDYFSPNLTDEQLYYMGPNYVGYSPYTHVKFAPYNDELDTSTNANPIPLMRVEEMYLIEAEALAMSGNTGAAKAALESFVQTYRDASYTCSGVSAEEIQEAVYFQRRIEFWGEGLSWFDIMRLNTGVDRRGAMYPQITSVLNIEAGSDILLWRIPEGEITANKLISESDNNPDADRPASVPDYSYE
ncbi:MAG: RagB/SusD family nutrient uptake outer membrane protein [Rikenellaceae bacterium]